MTAARTVPDLTAADMQLLSPPIQPGVTLLSAPIELAGAWGGMFPAAAQKVIERMRRACLEDLTLVSDRQPTRIRVDEHRGGSPAVWLHEDGSTTAWVIVNTAERAWSQLAYQFGHELGHVLANSWQAHAKPKPPCQWLEEALVEAFSLRGLGRLAAGWKTDPPFAGDNAYGDALAGYRRDVIARYGKLGRDQGVGDLKTWFARHRSQIEVAGLNPFAQAAAARLLAEYERRPECVAAIGALNRWPGRSALPITDYLRQWTASCAELGVSPALPAFLTHALGLR